MKMTQQHKNNISKARKWQNIGTARWSVIMKDGKKLCPMCLEWKSLSEYDRRPERPIGVKPKCKKCSKIYRASMPEMVKLAQYKSGAKKRGIDFLLSKDDFMALWNQPCFYCGDDISTIGIDRIDSSKCYSIDNVVPCCSICNTMKLALPRNIFVHHCIKVAQHLGNFQE